MSPNLLVILYWVSTILFSLAMLAAAIQYLTSPKMAAVFSHLGFPGYFRVELAVAKILGVAALLMPGILLLKEWAYAGFTFTLISAFLAHVASKDGPKGFLPPLFMGILLAVSYFTSHPVL
jgi:hypothetical protein